MIQKIGTIVNNIFLLNMNRNLMLTNYMRGVHYSVKGGHHMGDGPQRHAPNAIGDHRNLKSESS